MADQISGALRRALSEIPGLRGRFESADKDLGLPLIGSHEWDDRLAGWGGANVASYGSIKLTSAVDHLFAWHCLAAAWLPAYAHLTLLRPALEGAVQARWVLDPTVGSATRIARAFALRLDDLRWATVAEEDIMPEGAVDTAASKKPTSAEKRQTAMNEATAAGVVRVKLPRTEALLKTYHLREDHMDVLIWRYTSGAVHAQAWVRGLSDQEIVRAGATMTSAKESMNEPVAALMTKITVAHVSRAIEDLREYHELLEVAASCHHGEGPT